MKWTSAEIAILGFGTTLLIAVLSALIGYFSSKRERQRKLYSEAIQAVLSWKEMLYRVRRRTEGQEGELVKQFHLLQDNLSFYEAWIGVDSKYMSRSYSKLVEGVKSEVLPLIRKAWDEPIRSSPGNATDTDVHPEVRPIVVSFLADVRSHLSPNIFRKIAVQIRNTEQE